MSNLLVNRDQKSRPHYQPGRIRKALGAALFVALASSIVLTGLQAKTVAAEINRVSAEDHLVSPDIAEYMHKQGHAWFLTKWI